MFNAHKNKILILSLVAGLLVFGSLAFQLPQTKPEKPHRNLKILPKDISHPELIAIMHDFCNSLNYKCGDCHAASTTDPGHLDFASDANPKKEVARHMMRMVRKINRKYFKVKGKFAENYVQAKYAITCYTCHHGNEHPLTLAPAKKKRGKSGSQSH